MLRLSVFSLWPPSFMKKDSIPLPLHLSLAECIYLVSKCLNLEVVWLAEVLDIVCRFSSGKGRKLLINKTVRFATKKHKCISHKSL